MNWFQGLRGVLVGMILALGPVRAGDAIRLYYEAVEKAKASDDEAALTLYTESAVAAGQEGLGHYVFHASQQASSLALRFFRDDLGQEHAERALAALAADPNAPWARTPMLKINEIELLGNIERACRNQGRLGEAWQRNHRTITRWQEHAGLPVDPDHLDPTGIAGLSPPFRALGWRLVERESEYLHFVGRTTEARTLLKAAVEGAAPDLRSPGAIPGFYAIKLLDALAHIEDFTGYKSAALELRARTLSLFDANGPRIRRSHQLAHMNYLTTKSSLHGTTEELLAEAQEVLAEVTAERDPRAGEFARLLATIAGNLHSPEERMALLRRAAAASEDRGHSIDSFYADRDHLFERARLGAAELDPEFQSFLAEARERGNKRAEPRIYRRYGDWLRTQQRFDEAITVYREALRMTAQFEWHPLLPLYYAKLGATFLANGQPDAAREMWVELNRAVHAHPDIPAPPILDAWAIQLFAQLRAGQIEEARAVAKLARSLTDRGLVPEPDLLPFLETSLADLIASLPKDSATPPAPAPADRPLLQPLSVSTLALPGCGPRATFYLLNPGASACVGTLVAHGHGLKLASEATENSPAFAADASLPNLRVPVPLTIPAGSLVEIPLAVSSANPSPAAQRITLTWEQPGAESRASVWQYSWGEQASHAVVLDAARLHFSPFIGIPLKHHFTFPADHAEPLPFRVRTPTAMHVEYRDPATGHLLATDRNGNGLFTEQGELFPPQPEASTLPSAPLAHPVAGTREGAVEVWLFPTPDDAPAAELSLPVEIYVDGAWVAYATNVLQSAE